MITPDDAERIRRFKIFCATTIGIAALILMGNITYSVITLSYCPYCYAQRTDRYVLMQKQTSEIEENQLTRYWRSQVDPKHNHSWQNLITERDSIGEEMSKRVDARLGYGYWTVGFDFEVLAPQAAVAILESFETPTARKAFAVKYLGRYGYTYHSPRAKRFQLHQKLTEAYIQNPARKDWQKILKQLGVIK